MSELPSFSFRYGSGYGALRIPSTAEEVNYISVQLISLRRVLQSDLGRSEFDSCGFVPPSCFPSFSDGKLAFRSIFFLHQLVSLFSVLLSRKKSHMKQDNTEIC